MKTVTQGFLDAVPYSHDVALLCEVIYGGVTTHTDLEVVSGSVTLDNGSQIRGSADVTLTGEWAPLLATDPVTPYGAELRLWRGIELATGPELVPLITMRIESATVDDAGSSFEVRVSGYDRGAAVSDARFEIPYSIAAGVNVCDAIQAMVDAAVPGLTWHITPTDDVTVETVWPEMDDPLDAAIAMAASIGYEFFFDGYGDPWLRPEPDPAAQPVATIAEGDGGVLVAVSKVWTRKDAFNAVIASGENTSLVLPVRGTAYDLDPASPTMYGGPFGKVPSWFNSPLLATDEQAVRAAEAELRRELGVTEQVSFGTITNPALEPGDVVLITRERMGIDRSHIIDRITIPLDLGDMTATTRSRQAAVMS